MACKCNDVTSILRCVQCGRIQTIGHSKKEDPLQAAKKENRKCQTCYSEEFVVG